MRAVNAERGDPDRVVEPAGQAAGAVRRAAVGRAAEAHGVTPGQVILRWQVQLGSIPIPKSATPERQRAEPRRLRLRAHRRRGGGDHGARAPRRAALRRRPGHPRGDVSGPEAARPRRTSASTSTGCAPTSPRRRSGPRPPGSRCARTPRPTSRPRSPGSSSRPGAVGLTVATIGEAEVFAAARRRATSSSPTRCGRRRAAPYGGCATSPSGADLAIGVDSVEGAARAGRLLGAVRRRGAGRGRQRPAPQRAARPTEAGAVAAAAARAGLPVRGRVHLPRPQLRPRRAWRPPRRTRRARSAAALASFRAAGLEPDVVSGGSTPSWAHADTEVADRAATRGLRLRRRPAVGARHDGSRATSR